MVSDLILQIHKNDDFHIKGVRYNGTSPFCTDRNIMKHPESILFMKHPEDTTYNKNDLAA